MYCSQCGSELATDARFCANCGASIPGEAKVPDAAPKPRFDPYDPQAGERTSPPATVRLSSAWRRLGGYLLEGLLILLTLLIGWLVWSIIVWGRGQTPAKQLL